MRPPRTLSLLVLLGLAACDSATEERAEVTASRVVMRPHVAIPAGALPRGAAAEAEALAAPGPTVTPDLLRRGEKRFLVFCSPCHGAQGLGNGTVVSRGFPAPPSLHDERLRVAPPEHVVGVITQGIGRMYPYAERVPPADRWAIARYVKALQARGPTSAEAAPAQ